MVALTPELAGNSIIVLGISYVVAFAVTLYTLYLNWKQAKVEGQMKSLLDESRKQTALLQEISGNLARKK